jgi:hypothetical protein
MEQVSNTSEALVPDVIDTIVERADSGAIITTGPSVRSDSWENLIFGIGGPRDPSSGTVFRERGRLPDTELEALMAQDHFAAKIVEGLPRHAMRPGWDLSAIGEPQKIAALRDAYAAEESRLLVRKKMREGAFWGRTFGGAVTWIGVNDGGAPQYTPLDETKIRSVDFLHTFDRRHVFIWSYYQDPQHPKYGEPESYRLLPVPLPSMSIAPLGAGPFGGNPNGSTFYTQEALKGRDIIGTVVHETRLVRWPGQVTTFQRRLFLQGWDDSIFERCWEALKQVGEDFAGKSLLLGRISQAVYKIKRLYEMGAGQEAEALAKRMAIIDMTRSRARAVLLDQDREDFLNVAQPMAGMSELMDRGIQRLAAAGNMPVSILIELASAGAEAASDADVDRWDEAAEAWREEELRQRHEYIARLILTAKDGPTTGTLPDHWTIKYRPLRTARPMDAANVRKTNAEAAAIAIDKGIAPPEAYSLAWFTGLGTGEPQLDVDEVKAALDRRRELARQPPKDNAELGTVAPRAAGQIDVIKAVAQGSISRESGIEILVQTFRLTKEQADAMLGPDDFEPRVTPPKMPGPPPAPQLGQGAGAPQGLPGLNAGGDPNTTKDETRP